MQDSKIQELEQNCEELRNEVASAKSSCEELRKDVASAQAERAEAVRAAEEHQSAVAAKQAEM